MKNLKKIDKIMYVGIGNEYYFPYQNICLVLEKLAKKFFSFEYRLLNLRYGKDIMNKLFLQEIEKEKPEIIFFFLCHEEFYIETLLKIREISPKSIILTFFPDDDTQFESFSRYYGLMFDYCYITHKQCLNLYKKDGLNNALFATAINTDNFKPLKTEKKYDVTHIGAPKSTRYKFIKYLLDNGINVKIFGREWHDYLDIQKHYLGPLTNKEMVRVINESKINLCFSRNLVDELHFKGRIFEVGACNSFMLVEYFSWYLDLFKENKEIVMWKDKEELLKKVKYYLSHEKEREEIAARTYKKVNEEYNFFSEMNSFFKKISGKKLIHKPLPKLNKKMVELEGEDMNLGVEELKNKLKDFDYVCFNNGIINKDKHKEYFQIYSLEKSKKPISCCNCYISNKRLGNYLYLQANPVLNSGKPYYYEMASINQLAATKEYFFGNLQTFKDVFKGKKIDFLTKENTVIIEIPLVAIPFIGKYLNYKEMKPYFLLKFLYKLYSLRYQKRLFKDPYIYWLLLEMLKGNIFLLWLTIDALKDKQYKDKLNELREQLKS